MMLKKDPWCCRFKAHKYSCLLDPHRTLDPHQGDSNLFFFPFKELRNAMEIIPHENPLLEMFMMLVTEDRNSDIVTNLGGSTIAMMLKKN
ncbi:hypothetical protein RHSIM_Rhsim05G0034700 [Rhododendron simsii]|uniref:Uncharacterized protein n=1 Tax=Rhododendron simsii TaxID=118357 RepID=A0A834H811_RHOSS|nr:hypothetical protein RHSIM_Rhsim05G0034700 [Rhododendron simsii]